MGGRAAQGSKWEFSGRKWRLQHVFKVNRKCELPLQVSPQADSPRTVSFTKDLRDTLSLSITHQQFEGTKGGYGRKAAFQSQTFVFLNKGYDKTNV